MDILKASHGHIPSSSDYVKKLRNLIFILKKNLVLENMVLGKREKKIGRKTFKQ